MHFTVNISVKKEDIKVETKTVELNVFTIDEDKIVFKWLKYFVLSKNIYIQVLKRLV